MEALLEATAHPAFVASPVTLDVLRYTVDIPGFVAVRRERSGTAKDEDTALADLARRLAEEEQPWDHRTLCDYALRRVRAWGEPDRDVRVELLVGALFHAGRLSDPELTLSLLVTLVQMIGSHGKRVTGGRDLPDALENLEERGLGTEEGPLFGEIQAKLATANASALTQLYDAMPLGLRFRAKRALISRVAKSGLQEDDPTHEVVDVATSHLERLVGPLSNASQVLSATASLQRDFRSRREGAAGCYCEVAARLFEGNESTNC